MTGVTSVVSLLILSCGRYAFRRATKIRDVIAEYLPNEDGEPFLPDEAIMMRIMTVFSEPETYPS